LPLNRAGAAPSKVSMSTSPDASWVGLEIRHLAALEAVDVVWTKFCVGAAALAAPPIAFAFATSAPASG
jgi:hypothetical protein